MSLEVRIGNRRRQVDLRREGDHYRGRVNELSVEAEVLDRGPSSLLVRVGERTYDVTFDMDGPRLRLDLGSRQVALEILDPLRSPGAGERQEDLRGRREVRAAMPGKVVAVKVRVGELVARGHGLMILEAMKMENEVPSPRAGTVVSLGVSEGQTVEAGELLAAVE